MVDIALATGLAAFLLGVSVLTLAGAYAIVKEARRD